MERYLIIIIVGVLGAIVAQKLHIPGGAIVGSMVGAGLMTMLIGNVSLSPKVATSVQIILGISLGLTFDKSFLQVAPKILPLALGSTMILLLVALGMAVIASKLGIIDFGSAIFGFSPGGMGGMSILAKTEGYNPPVVAFLHMIRVLTLFIVVPIMAQLVIYFKQ